MLVRSHVHLANEYCSTMDFIELVLENSLLHSAKLILPNCRTMTYGI